MKSGPKPYTDVQRIALFWSRVKVGEPDECWKWQGAHSPAGYGRFRWQGRTVQAHRLAFFLSGSYLPEDLHVCHACDNPSCCNPGHLFAGTDLDNRADQISKGRDLKGEAASWAKLTEAQVREIRLLSLQNWSQHRIAKHFGVTQGAIKNIVHRKTWKHVV